MTSMIVSDSYEKLLCANICDVGQWHSTELISSMFLWSGPVTNDT